MVEFLDKFDTLIIDYEFGFKADDKLITMIIASLSYEYIDREEEDEDLPMETIIGLDQVSSSIYFLFEGAVDITYKEMEQPFVTLSSGSYFGEISFIFQIRN